LWLLPRPRLLENRDHRPWWDGELHLGEERERIETGWWDGFEVARDYFVATTVKGERLWIYRELKGRRRWFLHGLFA
jgi:protein ImuB